LRAKFAAVVLDVLLASVEHLIAQKLTVKLVSEVKSMLFEYEKVYPGIPSSSVSSSMV
jgi:hypothetical protein